MAPGEETDLHTLAGAYAMDAVDDADRAAFEQHLAACAECRSEIRGLREATARLAEAAAVPPRAGLRAATLRAAVRIRQLPPDTGTQPAPGRLRAGGRQPGRGLTRRARLAGLGTAAVLAAAVVVLALVMHGTQRQLDQADGRSQAVAAVLSAPDAIMLTADIDTGGTATVVMSHRRRALVFTTMDLRVLPAGQRYELWLMGPAGVRPAGMLPGSRAGLTGPMVVSGLAAGDRIGLTAEPVGGSARPTSPAVLMLRLSRPLPGRQAG
jgi:anti-sigma-K factor RskA